MARGRRPHAERPVELLVKLHLYPSRHQAVLDYLQPTAGLSRAAKVVIAITAALNGGGLSPAAIITRDEEATMLADMEGLFS